MAFVMNNASFEGRQSTVIPRFPTDDSFSKDSMSGFISDHAAALIQYSIVGLWFIVAVGGLCTNYLNIRTFLKMNLDESVIISFLALSISDFVICAISVPEIIAKMLDMAQEEFYVPPLFIRLYLSLFRRIFHVFTIAITIFLSLQRCLCILMPFHVKGLFTPFRTYCFIVIAFVFPAIFKSAYLAMYEIHEHFDTTTNTTRLVFYFSGGKQFEQAVIIVIGVFITFMSQAVIMICLVVIGYGLRQTVQFRKSVSSVNQQHSSVVRQTGSLSGFQKTEMPSSGNQRKFGNRYGEEDILKSEVSRTALSAKETNRRKEATALIQVAFVATIYVICNTPNLLITIVRNIEPEIALYGRYSNMYVVLYRSMFLCEVINSSVNLFVYYRYNSKFRKIFRHNRNIEP